MSFVKLSKGLFELLHLGAVTTPKSTLEDVEKASFFTLIEDRPFGKGPGSDGLTT